MLLLPRVMFAAVFDFKVTIALFSVLLPWCELVLLVNSIEVETPRLCLCELKLSYDWCMSGLNVVVGLRALFPLPRCIKVVDVIDFFCLQVFVWLLATLKFENDCLSSLLAENLRRSTFYAIEFIYSWL